MTRETIKFPRRLQPAPQSATEQSTVGVWGVGKWLTSLIWGTHDSDRNSSYDSPTDSTGLWGFNSWVTDFYIRW